MSDVIKWEAPKEAARPPFEFTITLNPDGTGWKESFELPALDDPGVPLELLQLALLVLHESDEEERGGKALVGFIEYFRAQHKRLYKTLDRHPATAPVLLGVIQRWAEHSEIDPKALNS